MNTEQQAYPVAGDTITVLEWLRSDDRSYVGQPLDVVAVDPPFLAVRHEGRIRPLDMRHVRVMRLSKDYVKALAVAKPQSEGPFSAAIADAYTRRIQQASELRPAPDSSQLWRDLFGGGAK
jgi:hypothetical protein